MSRDTVMILEDDPQRIESFRVALLSVDPALNLLVWRDAPAMRRECPRSLAVTCLISLDHDLASAGNPCANPGSGMDIALFLAQEPPACPILVHTSNYERAGQMCQVLQAQGWQADRVIPSTEQWIWTSWLPKVQALLS